jgi:hypothetical protein
MRREARGDRNAPARTRRRTGRAAVYATAAWPDECSKAALAAMDKAEPDDALKDLGHSREQW